MESKKLKPAKQAMADAIHHNGGWIEQANYAVQSGCNLRIHFTDDDKKPVRCAGGGWKCQYGFMFLGSTIPLKSKLKNWHQCVLSSEEYYHAYPKADADGWIEWNGGECHVDNDSLVDVKFPDGSEYFNTDAYLDLSSESNTPISHYRQSKKVVKPEFCESVTRSIPEPEAKPTIERLAHDYRNKLDFANRKQREADDAKAATDAALGEIERYCEAVGLLVSPIREDVKQDISITDWRDLKVGDEVRAVRPNGPDSNIGDIGVITKISDDGFWSKFKSTGHYYYFDRHFCDGRVTFIRRP